jgi:hypothetical protein
VTTERNGIRLTYKAQREVVEGLRALANDIEEFGVKLPINSPSISMVTWIYDEDDKTAKEQMAEAARLLRNAQKVHNSSYFDLRKFYGPIKVEFTTMRENVCRRVVVGVEEIPEEIVPARVKPARKEEKVEWVCDEPLLAN